jgi:hypothetical protein
MNQRSEPGLGRIVGIYLLDRADNWRFDSHRGQPDGVFTTMCGSRGEDFSTTGWPVVVKAHAAVSREDLARHLRDLADRVDGGFFMAVDPDDRSILTGYPTFCTPRPTPPRKDSGAGA